MARIFEKEGNHEWVKHLQDLVYNYNDSFHRSIGMKPKDVNEDNKFIVWIRLFGHLVNIKKPRYKVGDFVRILHFDLQHRSSQLGVFFKDKYRRRDEEGKYKQHAHAVSAKNKPPFSDEIFMVSKVMLGDPNVYKLYSEEAEEEILGIFYEEELSLVL